MQKYFFLNKIINLLISGSLLATQPDTFINALLNTSISAIGKQFLKAYRDKIFLNEGQFRILKKCHRKFDCLYNLQNVTHQIKLRTAA